MDRDGLQQLMKTLLESGSKAAARLGEAWQRLIDVFADAEARPRDEAEFLPAALEIVDTPRAPAARIFAKLIMAFFVAALLWATFGTVDVIAIAPGKIVPTQRTKLIQPLEAGVVRAIHVQDGQHVKAGAVLLEIDPTINEAEHSRLLKELTEARLHIARLEAAAAVRAEFISALPKEASEAQIELQQQMLQNQIGEYKAKTANLDQQIAQNDGNQKAIRSTLDKITSAMPYLEQRASIRTTLSRKGYSSKIDALNSEQDLIEHRKELEVQTGRLQEAQAAGEALKQQRAQTEAEFQRATLADLADAKSKADGLEQQLIQASQRTRLQTLTSPVDGTVQQLAIHTEGGVVTPAQVLLVVVPADAALEIEAAIANKDIGFVFAEQTAAVKIDTFNFTRYGLIDGTVVSVSQDAVTRQKPADQQPATTAADHAATSSEPTGLELVYLARIRLSRSTMDIDGKEMHLTPGMAVTAEIKTGTRRVIEYLLSPLQRYHHQALRER